MPVRINGSTSGYVELAAPAVAGSTSLTLPATSGTVALVPTTSGAGNTTSGQSTSSTSYVDVAGCSVTVTPKSSASRFLIQGMICASVSTDNYRYRAQILAGSTSLQVVLAGSSGTQQSNSFLLVLHSPATTAAITFKLQFASVEGANITLATGAGNGAYLVVQEIPA